MSGWDLVTLAAELDQAPLASPLSEALAIAVIADVLRSGGVRPPSVAEWQALVAGARRGPTVLRFDLRREQLGVVAHALQSTSLGAATEAALRASPPTDPTAALEEFLGAVFPLTAEMIRSNRFRREEMLRRWASTWRAAIAGETAAASTERLGQIDYRKALVEYERAEKARVEEAAKRAEALRLAQEAEAAARGWRE
jgi:hypothetical protein